ncbi:ArsR/SmtB family transcription factor [Knoellia sp. LjRoot47]|uniref:ArsR/SmtB family transcription factor n=1 Tax=Knoellia sp. LjRoot47 TaxID=3342330 RepID=UPI003ECF1B86
MDLIFRALADPTRRALLDALFGEDGQTLRSLSARFDMTRIGVAKHLTQLEEAGLVVSRRSGREKLHYLNPVGIRQVHDRWVSKYTEPWAAGLVGLKDELEAARMSQTKVFEIYIRTTPDRLWHAITDPDIRRRFHFGNTIASEWTQGSPYVMTHDGADGPLVDGENLEVDPPRRLVQSFRAHWDDDAESAGTSRVTWEIEEVGDSCRLTVVHDQLPDDVSEAIHGGWPMVLSGLKTWLETGTELTTPGSLMYG